MKTRFSILVIVVSILAACSAPKQLSKVMSPAKPNEGPCPAALVLWDAARKVQIGEPQVYSNVGFTGEILTVRSYCTYVGTDPVRANLEIDFAYGRGPAAVGNSYDYPYFVSVTRKNRAIIAKERYGQRISFPVGQDIVYKTEAFSSIVIPRAKKDTSGANFEIIVGFDMTVEELAYSRSGKRFRMDAGDR